MANMAIEGFSHSTTEETQYMSKIPCTKVWDGTKREVEFPGYSKVTTVTERHLAMVCENPIDANLALPRWHCKDFTDTLEMQVTGCISTSYGATSIWNATGTIWWQWVSSKFGNLKCVTQICVYTYSSSQFSCFESGCAWNGSQVILIGFLICWRMKKYLLVSTLSAAWQCSWHSLCRWEKPIEGTW